MVHYLHLGYKLELLKLHLGKFKDQLLHINSTSVKEYFITKSSIFSIFFLGEKIFFMLFGSHILNFRLNFFFYLSESSGRGT